MPSPKVTIENQHEADKELGNLQRRRLGNDKIKNGGENKSMVMSKTRKVAKMKQIREA